MSEHLEKIKTLLSRSADHIDEYGHHQFDMWKDKACCIMGAPRMVDAESSYSHIVRDLLDHIGYGETWNDEPGRTKEEVINALNGARSLITEQTFLEVYGPRWREIADLIVDVDNWGQDEYTEIEAAEPSQILGPGEIPDAQYLKSLVGFLGTVMTSGKTQNSEPFKNYFDNKYRKIQDERV